MVSETKKISSALTIRFPSMVHLSYIRNLYHLVQSNCETQPNILRHYVRVALKNS